jgi:hypothetical protein
MYRMTQGWKMENCLGDQLGMFWVFKQTFSWLCGTFSRGGGAPCSGFCANFLTVQNEARWNIPDEVAGHI